MTNLILGEEMLLKIGNIGSTDIVGEVFLKYMGTDRAGLKMKGRYPYLWREESDKITGPELFNNGQTFKVVGMDYKRNLLWIQELVINLGNRPVRIDCEPLVCEGFVGSTI